MEQLLKSAWSVALAALLWANLTLAGPQATVSLLDGSSQSGELTGASEKSIALETPQGTKDIPADRIMQAELSGAAPPPTETPRISVTLVDRCVLAAETFLSDGKTATLSAAGLTDREVSIRQIADLRLGPADEKVAASWEELRGRNARDDLVVIRKGDVLDYVAGSVGKITAEAVSVLVRDRELTAPRDKVFGIIYAARPAAPAQRRIGIKTSAGDLLQAETLSLQGNTLQVTAASLGSFSLPIERVQTLDYGGGRIRFLADLPFDQSGSKSPSEEAPVVWFVSRNAPAGTAGKAPLVIGNQEHRRGLWLHSGAALRFRLNREYTQLRGTAGFELTHVTRMPRFEPRVKLVITGDGKELFAKEFLWSDPPVALDVDLKDVRELTIRVESLGDQGGILEHFALGDVQVIQ
jgi:hypothetical protein